MRIRSIKPEFFIHDGIFELEKETSLPIRIAFVGLWCAADREGRFQWEPRRLGALILPYDAVDFSRVLDALVTRGFLVRYASDSREYGAIPSFTRHQVINNRESQSILPAPQEADRMGLPTRAPRVDDACPTPLEQDQGEGKGREGERKGRTKGANVRRVPFSEDEFDHLLSPAMRANPQFLDAWHQWCTFRKSKGNRITEVAAKLQIKSLYAAGIPSSIAAISKSIASGWTGIFLDGPQQHHAPAPQPEYPPTFEEQVASGKIKPIYRGPTVNIFDLDDAGPKDG